MRIIGGEWRGRKIEEPRGRDVTRPTTDRVREACASMVMSAFNFDLDEVRVLDAFGGSGALGLEIPSRVGVSLPAMCWRVPRAVVYRAAPLIWSCSTRPMLLVPSRSRNCCRILPSRAC